MTYDFTKKDDIDAWYIATVEQAIKLPLKRHLSERPNTHEMKLNLCYDITLSGLNYTRHELNNMAGFVDTKGLSLEDILREIRGI